MPARPTRQLAVTFGAMARPIAEQIAAHGLGYPFEKSKKWQKIADAITLLSIHGMISDKVKETARTRLMRMITAEMNAHLKAK